MSIRHIWVLKCDHPGCTTVYYGEETSIGTRQSAHPLGWTKKRVLARLGAVQQSGHWDYCPEHPYVPVPTARTRHVIEVKAREAAARTRTRAICPHCSDLRETEDGAIVEHKLRHTHERRLGPAGSVCTGSGAKVAA
jgi:hypothetical protein